MHAQISSWANGSRLLHELVHNSLGARSESGAKWIVEGLAEYYSIELLRRTGTASEPLALADAR